MLDNRIEKLARFLRIALGEQFHGTLHVREQNRDLFALAFEGALGGEDFFSEMLRGIDFRRNEARGYGSAGAQWLPTLKTELCSSRKLRAAHSALEGESSSALQTKFCLGRILLVAARTPHNATFSSKRLDRSNILIQMKQVGRIILRFQS